MLGTNPISVAAPGPDGDSFVLDMATSTVALGKVVQLFIIKSSHHQKTQTEQKEILEKRSHFKTLFD